MLQRLACLFVIEGLPQDLPSDSGPTMPPAAEEMGTESVPATLSSALLQAREARAAAAAAREERERAERAMAERAESRSTSKDSVLTDRSSMNMQPMRSDRASNAKDRHCSLRICSSSSRQEVPMRAPPQEYFSAGPIQKRCCVVHELSGVAGASLLLPIREDLQICKAGGARSSISARAGRRVCRAAWDCQRQTA